MALKFIFLSSLNVLVAALAIAIYNLQSLTFYEKNLSSPQEEIKLGSVTPVLTEEGKLSKIGWAKSNEFFSFSPKNIKASSTIISFLDRFRYKKWEAFVLVHKNFTLGTAVFDLSYLGGYFLHFSDLNSDKNITLVEHLNPFHKPDITDDCRKNCNDAKFLMSNFDYNQTKTEKFTWLNIKHNSSELSVDIDVRLQNSRVDSIVTLNPISNDTTLFYYNVKAYSIPVKGKININGVTINDSEVHVAYDQGRGVWPLRSGWIWVSGAGFAKNGEKFALNFGHGFNHPNASKHTEDAFFVNGRIHKLEAVETRKEFDENSGKYEWYFESKSSENIKNTCKVKFIPIKNKMNKVDLIIASVNFELNSGRFVGKCVSETGEEYEFDINGILENKISVW